MKEVKGNEWPSIALGCLTSAMDTRIHRTRHGRHPAETLSCGADNLHGTIFRMTAFAHHRPHIRTAVLRARGTVTIPQDVRERLDLAEGDQLVVTVEEDRIVLTPTSVIPDDQAWFWTPEWQAKEAEADQAAARGERGTVFGSGEEFLAFLDENMNMKPGR